MVDVVSTETSESDCDIEGRPGNQIAGAGVGVRAHEHSDRQTCRLYVQSAIEANLGIGMLGGRADDDRRKRGKQGVVVVGGSPRKLAPVASQSGRRDRREEIRESSDHSRRR